MAAAPLSSICRTWATLTVQEPFCWLDASTGYAPRVFSRIMLNGRRNTGAALGNIGYDRTNKQLFVSDLETGMIHRIRAADGCDSPSLSLWWWRASAGRFGGPGTERGTGPRRSRTPSAWS